MEKYQNLTIMFFVVKIIIIFFFYLLFRLLLSKTRFKLLYPKINLVSSWYFETQNSYCDKTFLYNAKKLQKAIK